MFARINPTHIIVQELRHECGPGLYECRLTAISGVLTATDAVSGAQTRITLPFGVSEPTWAKGQAYVSVR